jgi:hypothetical protein
MPNSNDQIRLGILFYESTQCHSETLLRSVILRGPAISGTTKNLMVI